jgi:hypothetical protein
MNSFRFLFATCSLLFIQYSLIAQASTAEHNSFCSSLMNVLQIGKYDNFESIGYTRVKASPFLEVPVAPAKMLRFPVVYVDKDSRFVGKSNITYDSLSALRELEVLKDFVGVCLDTAQWQKWNTEINDDPSTVFFTEFHRAEARSADFLLTLAMVRAGNKTYSIHLFIRKKKG